MNMEEYIKNKLEEFKHSYSPLSHLNSYMDRHIKQRWKEDYERMQSEWRSVKSISDVERYINGFTGTVNQYDGIKGLFTDAYDMDLALYRALNAIQKMAQCYDYDDFDFHTYNENDIDKLFDGLYEGLEQMHSVNMRRAMQD